MRMMRRRGWALVHKEFVLVLVLVLSETRIVFC
jgi:hypothetical protein